MPSFTIPGPVGPIHVVDLREESPEPSGALPIVFVHGMVMNGGVWNAALAACADKRQAIALDLRGHGASAPPTNGDYSIERCSDDVLAVLDALALREIVLVGHSLGALVAIETAARRPDNVRRLILVDAPGDFTTLPAEFRDTELLPFVKKVEQENWRDVVRPAFEQALAGGTEGTSRMIRTRLDAMPHDSIVSIYRSMMSYPAIARLDRYLAKPGASVRAITAPPNAWPYSLHVLRPAIDTTVIPDVGHWLMLDAPQEFVAALEAAIRGT
jgi:pimeloyl-ACP methyl ester carboxylesterase